ncbi:MAG: DUF4349 domain-containing protein [Propionibacteriaceae bacterium]|nr:DUF4349 domain-containing protein [Propionibacteriaceae bacterium]
MSISTRIIAALVSLAFLLTGCSASGLDLPSGLPGVTDETRSDPEVAAAPQAGAATDGAAVTDESTPLAGDTGRMIARTMALTLVVDDIPDAARQVREVAASLEGWVSHESLSLDEAGAPRGSSEISISVPASQLEAAAERLGALGTVRNRETSAQDVTQSVVDTDARIRMLEASITRLEDLMSRAGSVSDIAAVESELTSRQAEVESLKAQRLQLAGQVERSTVSVRLLMPKQSTSTNPIESGWSRGWEAFVQSVALLVTLAAGLLPFALVAALVIVPILWWRRKRRAKASAPLAQESAVSASPDAAPSDGDRPNV